MATAIGKALIVLGLLLFSFTEVDAQLRNNAGSGSELMNLFTNEFESAGRNSIATTSENTKLLVSSDTSVLSLIVDGRDAAHLQKFLSALMRLKREKNVVVGEVIVVGLNSQANAEITKQAKSLSRNSKMLNSSSSSVTAKTVSSLDRFMESISLSTSGILQTNEILSRYDIERSPTWIIRHKGSDYVLEGVSAISGHFNKQGVFTYAEKFAIFETSEL